jgi:predicted thioesterase
MAPDHTGPTPGDGAEIATTVDQGDTAIALGSGDVAVLGTPRLIALCEAATVAAVGGRLDATATTVGIKVTFEHIAASKVGAAVRAEAVLEEVDGRILRFKVRAFEGDKLIGRGEVVRAIVDRDRFLESS